MSEKVLVIWDSGEEICWFIAGEEFLDLQGVLINLVGSNEQQKKLTSLMYAEDGAYAREVHSFENPLSIEELGCQKIVFCGFAP